MVLEWLSHKTSLALEKTSRKNSAYRIRVPQIRHNFPFHDGLQNLKLIQFLLDDCKLNNFIIGRHLNIHTPFVLIIFFQHRGRRHQIGCGSRRGPQPLREKVPNVAKWIHVSKASYLQPESRVCLRALDTWDFNAKLCILHIIVTLFLSFLISTSTPKTLQFVLQ